MGKLTILGNANPVIGKEEMYSVSSMNGDWLNPLTNTYKNPLQTPKIHWEVMVQTKTGWRKGGSDKEGQTVPYTFGQKSLMHKGIKIIVEQGEDKGELIVHPQRAKEPKITKVELLDANYKPITKGKKLSYRDTIIARAYCVEMFNMQVAFTLWEDDARGEAHDPITNALNKINLIPVLETVNIKGIAEAVFRLPIYTMAVQIANARIASGDKNEGATHEYYVTADVVSKNIQKASENVNVVNPTYELPKRQRTLPQNTPTPKPAPPKEKPKPKENSPKFPVTTGGKSQSDGQGKILSAEFVDKNGNRLHSSKVGTTVFLKITAKNMKNKKAKVKIWEEDNFRWTNDLIFEKDYVLVGDTNFVWVQLTQEMFDKANDGSDSNRQDYFIEVIYNKTSVDSDVMPVSADAEPTKVPKGKSVTVIKEVKVEKKEEGKKEECCVIDEEFFLTNYEKEFPTKDKKGKIIPLSGLIKISLRRVFKSISEYYANEKKCCNKYRIAYMLATVKHETGHTFDPVEEANWLSWKVKKKYFEDMYDPILGKNEARRNKAIEIGNTSAGDGVKYYGRGYVQITGKTNYQKMKDKFNVDFVNDVTKVAEHEWAMKILIYGSEDGIFTGKKLSNYIVTP
ncbi:hypothetical protein NAL32_17290 [Chryseobacterium sp. Ch-15]|uniref:Chitinase n=1 Tax=Chryseobacterium muglaense TaxID=2893752 RepID=A0A9Q3UXA9_9FLAO|nr:hypothetical protein [Chryseobacterium muglaense]MBD3906475.1 hypothetical protein [Chryseobacterium muglaense]MCC9036814.1 hypothetical protein [Chryseobacterium muglaense]MCM2556140.1 hypothetical protein [Chryseobacterium muglaense]